MRGGRQLPRQVIPPHTLNQPHTRPVLDKGIICGAETGLDPLTGRPPGFPGEIVGKKYPLVMSHSEAVPVATNCSTARTGQVAQRC